jgi:hypothetical protein
MRTRLLANKGGKLTREQWRDLVFEPLTPLLILLFPGLLLAGGLMGRALLAGRGLIFVLAVAVAVFVVPVVARAWRYSNAQILADTFYTGAEGVSRWLFWRPEVLYTAKGEPVRFRRRVAPLTLLKANTAYRVYYLEEATSAVLLSIAPADYPEITQGGLST